MFSRPLNVHRNSSRSILVACLLAASVSAAPAWATWSVVAIDTETLEVAVGSATCVPNINLAVETPAIVVGKGGGAAQSLVDSSGQRRQIMSAGFIAGTPAATILAQLIALPGSDINQEGIATTLGDAGTFSGAGTFAHSSGQTGSSGTLHYAIQGNVLTGRPVVEMAEAALVNTVGDLPAKFMAAMEAARAMGGDGPLFVSGRCHQLWLAASDVYQVRGCRLHAVGALWRYRRHQLQLGGLR